MTNGISTHESINIQNIFAMKEIIDRKLKKAKNLKRRLNRLGNRIKKNSKQYKELAKALDKDTADYTNTSNELEVLSQELDIEVNAYTKAVNLQAASLGIDEL